jgi:thiol:disulfide interchange protein DsbD
MNADSGSPTKRGPPPLRQWLGRIALVAAASVGAIAQPTAHAADFLDPEDAFKFSAVATEGGKAIEAHFSVADGYYLYRERLGFAVDAGGRLGAPRLPPGTVKFDETFNKEVVTYRGDVTVKLPVESGNGAFTLTATLQGCADRGLCYPPEQRSVRLILNARADESGPPGTRPAAIASASAAPDEQGRIEATLQSRSLLSVLPLFFVLGILLGVTPCVLPMVPILSSIIVGDIARRSGGEHRTPGKAPALLLALAYSLGMAIVYTAFGVAAGLAGEGLAAIFQRSWIVVLFAGLLVALAMSMFGFYDLQLPSSWQTRLAQTSGRFCGGRLGSVFAMGALGALVVGPCVAAPLAGALLYISQTADALIGGSALFAMACGMSVPLLLVGVSAGSLLPRAGRWMEWVKRATGALLIATAAWMISPVIPLASSHSATQQNWPNWARIESVDQLDSALRSANGKPVLVDFYADWCVSCKEMEHFTFRDPRVAEQMAGFRLLRVDVTANSDRDKALLRRFHLFGPPATLFFDGQGHEVAGARAIGFESAREFLVTLARATGPTTRARVAG